MSKLPKRTKKPKSKLLRKEARAAYLYLIPAFIGLIVLTYIPLIAVFGLSFFKWGGTGAPEWNGINNYIKLFTTDPYFKESIKVTVYFSLLAVVGSMVYSLIVAMLLNRKIPARGFFRAAFYLPYVLPAAAVYIGWSWLYNTEWGLFNYILSKLGIERLMFVSSSSQVVPSLALIAVWLSGNLIVIFLAGLQNVPRVYHEAAEIDGANWWQIFTKITMPYIIFVLTPYLITTFTGNVNNFNVIYLLTRGDPAVVGDSAGKTDLLITWLYKLTVDNNDYNLGAVIGIMTFVVLAVVSLITYRSSGSYKNEEAFR